MSSELTVIIGIRGQSLAQVVCAEYLDSAVLMVKAAEDRSRCHNAQSLNDAMERRVLGQGPVSAEFVVIVGIRNEDPP